MHLSSNSIRGDEIEKRGFLLRHKKASSSSFQDEPCFLSSSVTRDEKENENGFFAILEPLMDGCTFVPHSPCFMMFSLLHSGLGMVRGHSTKSQYDCVSHGLLLGGGLQKEAKRLFCLFFQSRAVY